MERLMEEQPEHTILFLCSMSIWGFLSQYTLFSYTLPLIPYFSTFFLSSSQQLSDFYAAPFLSTLLFVRAALFTVHIPFRVMLLSYMMHARVCLAYYRRKNDQQNRRNTVHFLLRWMRSTVWKMHQKFSVALLCWTFMTSAYLLLVWLLFGFQGRFEKEFEVLNDLWFYSAGLILFNFFFSMCWMKVLVPDFLDSPGGISNYMLDKISFIETIAEDTEEACGICLCEYMANDKVRVLVCSHRFHVPCLDMWFKNSDICPMCMRNTDALDSIGKAKAD